MRAWKNTRTANFFTYPYNIVSNMWNYIMVVPFELHGRYNMYLRLDLIASLVKILRTRRQERENCTHQSLHNSDTLSSQRAIADNPVWRDNQLAILQLCKLIDIKMTQAPSKHGCQFWWREFLPVFSLPNLWNWPSCLFWIKMEMLCYFRIRKALVQNKDKS